MITIKTEDRENGKEITLQIEDNLSNYNKMQIAQYARKIAKNLNGRVYWGLVYNKLCYQLGL